MDKLERLQLDLAAVLQTVAALQYTRVVVASPRIDADGNLVTAPEIIEALDRALNGIDQTNTKAGSIAVVQMPFENIVDHKLRGTAYPCEVSVLVRVEENQLINRGAGGGLRTCAELANDIFTALHGYPIAGAILQSTDKRGKEPKQYRDGILAYDLHFSLVWGREALARCAKPDISAVSVRGYAIVTEAGGSIITEEGGSIQTEDDVDGGINITLSTATAGASIYYTTDGSFPWSGNAEATLYTAPFILSEDCTLRAAAFKTGYNVSPLRQSSIDVA